MDALVTGLYVAMACFVIGFGGLLVAYLRVERTADRLRWLLDRTEADLVAERQKSATLAKACIALERAQQPLPRTATSQPESQEMQREAPDVVRVLPVAASRLAAYVKEQAMAQGQPMSDYDAEQAAAAMLVESGI